MTNIFENKDFAKTTFCDILWIDIDKITYYNKNNICMIFCVWTEKEGIWFFRVIKKQPIDPCTAWYIKASTIPQEQLSKLSPCPCSLAKVEKDQLFWMLPNEKDTALIVCYETSLPTNITLPNGNIMEARQVCVKLSNYSVAIRPIEMIFSISKVC